MGRGGRIPWLPCPLSDSHRSQALAPRESRCLCGLRFSPAPEGKQPDPGGGPPRPLSIKWARAGRPQSPPGLVAVVRRAAGGRAGPWPHRHGARFQHPAAAVPAHLRRDAPAGSQRPGTRRWAACSRRRAGRAPGPFSALRRPRAPQLTAHRGPPPPGHSRRSIKQGNRTHEGSTFGV
ncbi:hypothetical protein NDU88_006362 [Pleurodeles waltl]|uniref:Uncharacterized protein n=1 Tax=Pleurodeles waltl TaxID=8319 RepID=A0AAV7TDR8_PLEWA|nr:hypothetical protein NDU88_006362 [Pleurodeles waltl]